RRGHEHRQAYRRLHGPEGLQHHDADRLVLPHHRLDSLRHLLPRVRGTGAAVPHGVRDLRYPRNVIHDTAPATTVGAVFCCRVFMLTLVLVALCPKTGFVFLCTRDRFGQTITPPESTTANWNQG